MGKLYIGKFNVWALWSYKQFGFGLMWTTIVPWTTEEPVYEIIDNVPFS